MSHEKDYSENGLLEKLAKYGVKAGAELVFYVLVLWYTLKDDDVPGVDKAIIIGALGYFISPLDGVPDLVPVVGYGDDVTVVGLAISKVKSSINEFILDQAGDKMSDWFNLSYDQIERFKNKIR